MDSKPVRIQRMRTKGWRMPANTIYVGRPTEYGNQFVIGVDGDAECCTESFRRLVEALTSDAFMGSRLHSLWRSRLRYIHGKNLACWCRLDQPCHADILLNLANQRSDNG